METFQGYIIIKKYSSGSKSDGFYAYLYASPNKVYKLYRADVLPIQDTFFNEYHLKPVLVTGLFHQRIRSIRVENIQIVNDPFFSSEGTGESQDIAEA
jgi:hypothetical protein